MATIKKAVGLEGFVAGPYHWNAATYSGFFRDAYDNIIKAEVERLQMIEVEKRKQVELAIQNGTGKSKNCQHLANFNQNYDVKIAKLVQRLIDESGQVLGNNNWTDMIGKDLWDILKLDEYKKDRYKLDNEKDEAAALKKKSVVQLLKFIRNKISHIRTCNDEMKEKLGQFFEKNSNDEYQFVENKFVAFWISKFPTLVPYLWLKLYKFKEKLTNYYPDYDIEIGKLENFLMDTNKIEMELKTALFVDMENGNLLRRFKGPSCSLEFRGFKNLVTTLDKNVFITVLANPKNDVLFSVSHSSTNQDKLEYKGTAKEKEELIIIFADNITEKKMWKYCSNCNCKVIVFCDQQNLLEQNIEEAIGKFKYENDLTVELTEFPLRGSELSEEKQDWVFKNGEVCIQGKDMKINDIILDRNEILKELSGDLLCKILKQGKPVICGNYKYPEYKGVYINRRLYLTDANGKEKAKDLRKELAKEHYDYRKEISLSFHTKEMVPIHSCKKCTSCQVKNTGIIGVLGENEFVRRVNRERVKSTYILAKTGMGKSKLFLNLGKTFKNSLVIYCSFRIFIDILKKRVRTEECSKTDVKSVILEILKCSNDCERSVIDKWLERKGNKGAQIDLQLDGLDEVLSVNLILALKALEIIEKNLHAVRLWISSNKIFPSSEREFRFTYYGILPFSLRDKLDFFKEACRAKGLTEERIHGYSKCFSMRFISQNELVAFLDYPLNYSMLFELYEDNLDDLTMIGGKGVGVEVFDSLYQKKFSIMYREKKGIALDDQDDDFKMQREMYLQLYTYLALVHLFPQVSTKFVEPLGMQFFTKENYHKMGIITNNEPITFIHLKYADYFVARYIMKILETGKPDFFVSRGTIFRLVIFWFT